MEAKIIKTEAEYEAMLKRVDALMDAAPGSPEEDELELLAMLIEHYEEKHYPIGMPDPIDAIKFFMDQNGLSNSDMVPYFGQISKVSEVLNGKRELSKAMIRKLVEGLGIPAEILLGITPPAGSGITYPLPGERDKMVAELPETD